MQFLADVLPQHGPTGARPSRSVLRAVFVKLPNVVDIFGGVLGSDVLNEDFTPQKIFSVRDQPSPEAASGYLR